MHAAWVGMQHVLCVILVLKRLICLAAYGGLFVEINSINIQRRVVANGIKMLV